MVLSDMTWEEVGDYLKEKNGLIIPAGICEQHSTHLPLNTDTVVAGYFAEYLAGETGLLIAPVIQYGVGLPCDRCFSGTTGIRTEDLRNMLSSLVGGWKEQGFGQFFVITAHGDPFHLRALRETGHEDVFVLELYDIGLEDILEKQAGAKHAGEAETSVMLFLFPDSVRMHRIRDFETPMAVFRDYLSHARTGPIPDSPGCQGYPSFASREKGEKIVERMKAHAMNWIRANSTAEKKPG